MRFFAEDDGGDKHLVMSRRLWVEEDQKASPVEEETRVLAQDLENVSFEYLGGSLDDEEDPEWQPDWAGDDRERMPALVRLRASSEDSGVWPDLVVRLVVRDPTLVTELADPDALEVDEDEEEDRRD
jgi:hypothetical protein